MPGIIRRWRIPCPSWRQDVRVIFREFYLKRSKLFCVEPFDVGESLIPFVEREDETRFNILFIVTDVEANK